jgi:MYXO-CTERM domain-containing protein
MILRKTLALAALAVASAPALAGLAYTTDDNPAVDASSVNDLQLGSGMDGMKVTLTTVDGTSSTAFWAAGTGSSGGAASADLGGWSLAASGNTFAALWFFNYGGTARLSSLSLEGLPGGTVFDRTEPGPGSASSFQGRDFTVDLNDDGFADDPSWTVTYAGAVGLNGAAPVGDLFARLHIELGADGWSDRAFSFLQDTDRFVPGDGGGDGGHVPEPGSLALAALGLAAAARLRRQPTTASSPAAAAS